MKQAGLDKFSKRKW